MTGQTAYANGQQVADAKSSFNNSVSPELTGERLRWYDDVRCPLYHAQNSNCEKHFDVKLPADLKSLTPEQYMEQFPQWHKCCDSCAASNK
ncbi:hypothetical protein L2725_17565 [Shewanella corallii]|uniref:Uncharacterized protein n=2 Tax=Shewanella TaxID=22 RepID=A0ABT0NAT2_9GAMM|nr:MULTISPECIES: hypothetical protein [Shewanella]MCL1037773.1 hypothetical protein [Shewanella submarina]MCL2915566.1 hypothetical protein [Shewanella corallii]